jgi:hypothetical protein
MRRIGVQLDRLFVIPGNHDIDRQVGKSSWEELRAKISFQEVRTVSRWLAGEGPPAGLSNLELQKILDRQRAYQLWLAGLGLKRLLPNEALHPTLGYRVSFRLPGRPFDIHMLGLDSAWLAGDDNDNGKLYLTDDQVGRISSDIDGRLLPGFRIALVHHPLSHLADGSECRRLLAERIDLLLRGHMHDPEPSLWADPERTLRQVAAGCLYEHDKYPNACHVIDVELDENGRPLSYRLHFRRWSDRGHWHDDDGLYPGTTKGRMTLFVDSSVERHLQDLKRLETHLHPKVVIETQKAIVDEWLRSRGLSLLKRRP